jgi:hypothetical protein
MNPAIFGMAGLLILFIASTRYKERDTNLSRSFWILPISAEGKGDGF